MDQKRTVGGGKLGVSCLLVALMVPLPDNGLRDISLDASATDLLVFRDDCFGIDARLVASNPDGTGRQILPLILSRSADVSRGAPAVDALAVARNPDGSLPSRLFVLPIDRSGSGQILPGAAWQALDVPLTDATGSPHGGVVFSPGGQRIAFIGRPAGDVDGIGTQLYIADVVRDAAGHAVGIEAPTFVVDLMTLGSPADSSHPQAAVGGIDLSADGTKLLAGIYDDIWLLTLNPTGWVVTSATNLTRTPDFAETYPRWSPAADVIAFSRGGYAELGGRWWYSSDTNIFSLNAGTGAIRQITTKSTHKGSTLSADFPSWSPTGTHLLYSARAAGNGGRNSSCGHLVNYDLFRILAGGTQKTVSVTNTAGTSVEAAPRWGW